MSSIITLLTDFGQVDSYVAQMKAVILSLAPGTQVVDISHSVVKHDVAMGSFHLETTVPYFPSGTVHVAVVDPGVGGPRLPIVIECERGVLVGPDNGLLVGAAGRLGFRSAYRIENRLFMGNQVTPTFHGRDVFATTAARIAGTRKPRDAGRKVAKLVHLEQMLSVVAKNHVSSNVLYIDSFGNIVTNVPEGNLRKLIHGRNARLTTKEGSNDCPVVTTYSEIPRGKIGILMGSQGYLEVAMRESSAADKLGLRVRDRLDLFFS